MKPRPKQRELTRADWVSPPETMQSPWTLGELIERLPEGYGLTIKGRSATIVPLPNDTHGIQLAVNRALIAKADLILIKPSGLGQEKPKKRQSKKA